MNVVGFCHINNWASTGHCYNQAWLKEGIPETPLESKILEIRYS